MIITVWNVRGLNDPSKVADVRQLLNRTKSNLICLLETKVKQHKSTGLQRKIGYGLNWFYVTFVHGLHSIQDMKGLWSSIEAIGPAVLPWLCTGDFNSVLQHQDRINGNDVTDYEIRDFRNFVDSMNFVEIKSKGSYYSWSNKAHVGPRTLTRMDRGLVNFEWLLHYPTVEAHYLAPSLSGHSPLMYEVCPAPPSKGRPFRFFNCLISHPDFLGLVQESWSGGVPGNAMSRVWNKLRNLKTQLKTLNKHSFNNVDQRVCDAQLALLDVQDQMVLNPSNSVLMEQETDAIESLKYWRSVQESVYRQKSRIEWVALGDSNTKYFFFYDETQLMGSTSHTLNAVDLVTMRASKCLSIDAQVFLSSPITNAEIDCAIQGIGDDKAPGIDGFNAKFFKYTWDIIKLDIYEAVHDFFDTGTMNTQWNCTIVTLVPKVQNPTFVKDFRPIACCTVLYKIISKILTARLARLVGEVIDEAQAGFIPGKHIGDNILLATELIKGYSHKFISPRCMIKVDLKKAYDSIEWGFLRADEHSFQLLFNAFKKFSFASGLVANLSKSEVYFGGIQATEQNALLSVLGMVAGSLPFRYFGVPLSSKKLTIQQCKPLVQRITSRIEIWIFVLPKKILREIESRFKAFLWTGVSNPSRRALVAWSTVCLPRSCGGWNVIALHDWNISAVCKVLWDIAHKSDSLWVRWVHTYYFKQHDFWSSCVPNKCSWNLKKIMKCRSTIDNIRGWDSLLKNNKVQIKKIYNKIRKQEEKVPWRRVICNSNASPRSVFILWLANWNRLLTKDRVLKWNPSCDPICLLCLHEPESIQKPVQGFTQEVQWAAKYCRKSTSKGRLHLMFLAEAVWMLLLCFSCCSACLVVKARAGFAAESVLTCCCCPSRLLSGLLFSCCGAGFGYLWLQSWLVAAIMLSLLFFGAYLVFSTYLLRWYVVREISHEQQTKSSKTIDTAYRKAIEPILRHTLQSGREAFAPGSIIYTLLVHQVSVRGDMFLGVARAIIGSHEYTFHLRWLRSS
ncbi:uncharacterized protein LOC110736014 [Chenopodium quinoa]|uniref:uncharacterized protein LOC110736014 n=1 Tax=Chenopodium quinoa TaxID=63459 RepID=UPI000B77E41E|nr:uncharacterized protein LOC110736014 [Chenopodium quinoa]